MGVPYDANDLNLYKIRPYEYMEFLPSEEDSYEHLVPTVSYSSHLPFSNDADDSISVSGTSKLESNMKSLLLLKMGSGATVLETLWRLLDLIQRTACPSFGLLSVEGKFYLFLGSFLLIFTLREDARFGYRVSSSMNHCLAKR